MTILSFDAQHNKSFISLLGYICVILASTAFGMFLAAAGGREVTMSARTLIITAPSLSMLLVNAFFPFGLAFLSALWNRRIPLYLLIAAKTALFSFSACAVFIAFRNAGWLVQFLVLFSGWVEICVYHWLWMRLLVFQTRFVRRDFLICGSFLLLVILCDYLLICPFTASLFIHK